MKKLADLKQGGYGGLDRDVVEELWRKRKRKGQKKGDRIGYCNADRLQADENGIAALCTYLVKQAGGKKRWSSSHNLKKPTSRANDGKYNRRQIEKWAKEKPGRAFWEKKYPGWTLTDDDYGVQYEYNEQTERDNLHSAEIPCAAGRRAGRGTAL